MSAALLAARVMTSTKRSKYMSLASSLASEKIEDLNRWQSDNPQLCVPTGSASVGSLTANVVQTTTCANGASGSVNYYDEVSMSLNGPAGCPGGGTSGCFAETVSSLNAGVVNYSTTYHSPNGSITTPALTTVAPAGATFLRRWRVEGNTPVAGTRRVTVLVTLNDPTVQPPVNFQMSMVRK
jgi:hypothetical protein